MQTRGVRTHVQQDHPGPGSTRRSGIRVRAFFGFDVVESRDQFLVGADDRCYRVPLSFLRVGRFRDLGRSICGRVDVSLLVGIISSLSRHNHSQDSLTERLL